uniref:Reverse transcriptase domain-containing protein n=1 Tax=Tanacetum cinerariifolium TaxID=118510 RepID=A0A6L2L8B9_TANCI|nr:reverse transcriptase domain-containing protein [Tanacetum cinerariifolium]
MLLSFSDDIQDTDDEKHEANRGGDKGKTMVTNEDLSKPFKEVLKCPFTKRIIEFSSPWYRMSMNGDLQRKFLNGFGMLRACAKDPTVISEISRKANEGLLTFKERWVSESNCILNVQELMQISSFMSSHKCLELAKCFSDSIPKTVDEMFKRVVNYVLSEKASRDTELPKGEFQVREITGPEVQQNDRLHRNGYGNALRRGEHKETYRHHEQHASYVPPHRPLQDFQTPRENIMILTLESLVKWMNVPITFPPVLARDLSNEALVIEAEVEGARMTETQTTVSGFSGEQMEARGCVSSNEGMIKYLAKAKEYIPRFKRFRIKNVPRNQNQKADALSKLDSIAFNHLTKEILVEVLETPSTDRKEVNAIMEEEEDNWMKPIIRCLEEGNGRKMRKKPGISHKTNYVICEITWARAVCTMGQGLWWQKQYDKTMKPIHHNPFKSWCKKLNIKQTNTIEPHPQANGLMERANRSLMDGIKTRLGKERSGWVDELPNVLCAYQTSLKTSNGEIPFSLTYGSEAVILVEIGMPTHRTMMIKEGDGNEEEIRLNLDILQERMEAVAVREARYKPKME